MVPSCAPDTEILQFTRKHPALFQRVYPESGSSMEVRDRRSVSSDYDDPIPMLPTPEYEALHIPAPSYGEELTEVLCRAYDEMTITNPFSTSSASTIKAAMGDKTVQNCVERTSNKSYNPPMPLIPATADLLFDEVDTSFPPEEEWLKDLIPQELAPKHNTDNVNPLAPSTLFNFEIPPLDKPCRFEDLSPVEQELFADLHVEYSNAPEDVIYPLIGSSFKDLSLESSPASVKHACVGSNPSDLTATPDATRKQLFGDNGWLDTSSSKAPTIISRKGNLFQDLRDMGKRSSSKSLLSLMTTHPFTISPGSSSSGSIQLALPSASLNSFSQAKLYANLEFMICSTANDFLLVSFYDGRISPHSLSKVNSAWVNKNRPQVLEFYFDQATQYELVSANRQSLEFTGASQHCPLLVQQNLQSWKTLTHEMSIRTFCLPDGAIRKHLFDIEKILEMMRPSDFTMQHFHFLSDDARMKMLEAMTSPGLQSEADSPMDL
ncbi:hypothetical protein N7462_004857 [Penicillium macrosclerotiorum]|uniref:uncharacterized protein n=1 Tax=Penicillium macrosclerotiorum TaxID=303699 RepID=UPI002547A83A|nr:uncharacterized protein N7462_004857 [Penicillium macrosclerotiorum]KAJ5690465.1 hypothetical protein N7462_004857 [Penicillium macrosclerotiorum]